MVWTLDAAGGQLLAVPNLHLLSVSSVLVHEVERVSEIVSRMLAIPVPVRSRAIALEVSRSPTAVRGPRRLGSPPESDGRSCTRIPAA